MRYYKGNRFVLSREALENYGEQYSGKVFIVSQVSDHQCSPGAVKLDPTGHPGFNEGMGDLYDAEGLPFSLYSWEMRPAYSSQSDLTSTKGVI